MFNFKKIFDVAKRSICAALSAVMVLNMFSACAASKTVWSKVVLFGDAKSGKTALRNRIVGDTFSEEYKETFVIDSDIKNLQIEDECTTISLSLRDVAGKEKSAAQLGIYVIGVDLVLLTVPYDTPSDKVNEYLNGWANKLDEAAIPCNVKIVLTKNEPDSPDSPGLPFYNHSLKEQVETFISKHNDKSEKTFTFEKGIIKTSAKTDDENSNGIKELKDYIVDYLTQREKELLNNGTATYSESEEDDTTSASPQSNNKKWIIGGGIGAGALLIPAAAILIHKFCHKTPAPKKLA